MDGDFKGDFTRDTFDSSKQFSRVLMQQGRVQLDSDWNEQTDILLYYLRTLAKHIIGQHGGPDDDNDCGFGIGGADLSQRNFNITPGFYFVDGILIQKKDNSTYKSQPFYTEKEGTQQPFDVPLLVYLDVWERHITYLEDPSIREVALGINGPDTTTRAEVVWQVKVIELGNSDQPHPHPELSLLVDNLTAAANDIKNASTPTPDQLDTFAKRLKAITKNLTDIQSNKKCGSLTAATLVTVPKITSVPYRGAENRLYRVEIHNGGAAGNATFKWSRENGSVVFPILDDSKHTTDHKVEVKLESLGRDSRLSIKKDDWVEIIDDKYLLRITGDPDAKIRPLLRVESVESVYPTEIKVTLAGEFLELPDERGFLRRWDQDAVKIIEDELLPLEDNVHIRFQKNSSTVYRPGDYWIIPTRVETGEIIGWPKPEENNGDLKYTFKEPQGVNHHYAPLVIIKVDGTPIDLRYKIEQLGKPAGP
ncbi:MAG: DUF6519 domain-containing protein [Ktedonobacteraceae bacterium]